MNASLADRLLFLKQHLICVFTKMDREPLYGVLASVLSSPKSQLAQGDEHF